MYSSAATRSTAFGPSPRPADHARPRRDRDNNMVPGGLRKNLGCFVRQVLEPLASSPPRRARHHPRTAEPDSRPQGLIRSIAPGVTFTRQPHSHSIVPGGLLVMSSTTRPTGRISLIIREAICSSRSYGAGPSRQSSRRRWSPRGSRSRCRKSASLPGRRPCGCRATRRTTATTRGTGRPCGSRPGGSRRPHAGSPGRSRVASPPTIRIARPGPGKGWRQTSRSGRPSSAPTARTSSLNRARSGSTSSNSRSSEGLLRCGGT